MRRWVPLGLVTSLVVAGIALAAPAEASTTRHLIGVGHPLLRGQVLTSSNGHYQALLSRSGRLVLRTSGGTTLWRSTATGPDAHLTIGHRGNMAIVSHGHAGWRSDTNGSGKHNLLGLRNSGVLALRTHGGMTVWTTDVRTRCPSRHGKLFDVDLSRQIARMCRSGQQLRATPVTTGAVDRGNGTPRGTWHVQAKVRNTTLYPAAGGAYPVHYWVPYDGAYGIHDSPWQHFKYGSQKYRTKGSHGCTHVPAKMMAWFFSWARTGSTTVTIHK